MAYNSSFKLNVVMTGLEKLKRMTVARAAAKIFGCDCPYPNYYGSCQEGIGSEKCESCWIEWLNTKAEDDKAAPDN